MVQTAIYIAWAVSEKRNDLPMNLEYAIQLLRQQLQVMKDNSELKIKHRRTLKNSRAQKDTRAPN